QAIAERVLGDGTFDRHLTTIRPEYERKMNALHDALVAGRLPSLGWRWPPPQGGLDLGLQAPPAPGTGPRSECGRRRLGRGRPEYERKMNALHDALVAGGLPSLGWRWQPPQGGLYLWLEAPPALDTGLSSEFCRRCIDAGVLYVPGELCYPAGGPRNRVRLSFGVLGLDALAEAARRFAKVAGTF